MHQPPTLVWQIHVNLALPASRMDNRLAIAAKYCNKIPIKFNHRRVAINVDAYIAHILQRAF
jgi:hypothetical protein